MMTPDMECANCILVIESNTILQAQNEELTAQLQTAMEQKDRLEVENARLKHLLQSDKQLDTGNLPPGTSPVLDGIVPFAFLDVGPLLEETETILRKMCCYLDHASLISGRLVSQLWNETISPILLKRSTMSLDCLPLQLEGYEPPSTKLLSTYRTSDSLEYDEYDQTVRVPSGLTITLPPGMEDPACQMPVKWLTSYGMQIKDLEIMLIGTLGLDVLNKLFKLCPHLETFSFPSPSYLTNGLSAVPLVLLPRIQTLEIGSHSNVFNQSNNLQDLKAVKDVLQVTQNLKILRLVFGGAIDVRECFVVGEDAGYFEKLVELELNCALVTVATLQALAGYNFQNLKKLSFTKSFWRPANSIAAAAGPFFMKFLSNISFTLEELSIALKIAIDHLHPNSELRTILSLPSMQNLKKLKFGESMEAEQGSSIDFLQKFPSLQALSLDGWQDDENVTMRLFPQDLQFNHSSLRSLELSNLPMEGIEATTLTVLNRSFPRLEVLSLKISPDAHVLPLLLGLNNITNLSELSLYWVNTNPSTFDHDAFFKNLFSSEYPFRALKQLCVDCNRLTELMDTSFVNFKDSTHSLQYLELTHFKLCDDMKDRIVDSLQSINKVRFLYCITFNRVGKMVTKDIFNFINDPTDPEGPWQRREEWALDVYRSKN